MALTRLRQYLNRESYGNHEPGAHGALLTLIDAVDEIYLSLEEQERWLRDAYPLRADQCRNLVDQHVQAFLSSIILDTHNGLGEDYLTSQLCADDGGYEATQDALTRWKAAHDAAMSHEKLGELDRHPF
jgi:hypothetical protein